MNGSEKRQKLWPPLLLGKYLPKGILDAFAKGICEQLAVARAAARHILDLNRVAAPLSTGGASGLGLQTILTTQDCFIIHFQVCPLLYCLDVRDKETKPKRFID